MNSPKDNDELRQKIDDIVFRCFAQGQYWGSGLNKDPEAFDEDYRPENPIDRTEAVEAIMHLISTHTLRALERARMWTRFHQHAKNVSRNYWPPKPKRRRTVSGNKIGGRKAHMTLRTRLGEAGYREHMRAIGARGGKSLVQKGGLLDPRNRDQYPGKNKGRWLKDPQIKREQRLKDLEHGGRP